jgi:hypothetical protein
VGGHGTSRQPGPERKGMLSHCRARCACRKRCAGPEMPAAEHPPIVGNFYGHSVSDSTGTVEYASRQGVWEKPLHEIYGNEVANTSTPTRLETNVLNEVFKNANQRTCAVVRSEDSANTGCVQIHSVVQYSGDKTTRTLPELRPNVVPQDRGTHLN